MRRTRGRVGIDSDPNPDPNPNPRYMFMEEGASVLIQHYMDRDGSEDDDRPAVTEDDDSIRLSLLGADQCREMLMLWNPDPRVLKSHSEALYGLDEDVSKELLTEWVVASLGGFEEDVCLEALDQLTLDTPPGDVGPVWRRMWALQLYRAYRSKNGVTSSAWRCMLKAATGSEPEKTPCELRARRAFGGGRRSGSKMACTVEDIEDWIEKDLPSSDELRVLATLTQQPSSSLTKFYIVSYHIILVGCRCFKPWKLRCWQHHLALDGRQSGWKICLMHDPPSA